MEIPCSHPNVKYDEQVKQHFLVHNGRNVAVVNPLKKPVFRLALFKTNIHPDVMTCKAGELLLLHDGMVVAKVIPLTLAVERAIFGKNK